VDVDRIQELLISSRETEPQRFNRSPLPYPRYFDRAIDAFVVAVTTAYQGDVQTARRLIGEIADRDLVAWFHETAQHVGDIRYQLLSQKNAYLKRGKKTDCDLGDTRKRELAARDGHRCCYCGIRVIEPKILKKVQALIGRDVLPSKTNRKGSSNWDYHGIWITTVMTLDHINPISTSGRDDDGNLATSCWACNFGKYDYTLDELGLKPPNPKNWEGPPWHGLVDVIAR
jgi:5-methylcytosine-specific restriction endonuclease McrA